MTIPVGRQGGGQDIDWDIGGRKCSLMKGGVHYMTNTQS